MDIPSKCIFTQILKLSMLIATKPEAPNSNPCLQPERYKPQAADPNIKATTGPIKPSAISLQPSSPSGPFAQESSSEHGAGPTGGSFGVTSFEEPPGSLSSLAAAEPPIFGANLYSLYVLLSMGGSTGLELRKCSRPHQTEVAEAACEPSTATESSLLASKC